MVTLRKKIDRHRGICNFKCLINMFHTKINRSFTINLKKTRPCQAVTSRLSRDRLNPSFEKIIRGLNALLVK